jgi:Polyketide cyclase / dehydrase and lipid transport
MSTIDVSAEVDIAAAPADIAAIMFDPAREPEWMAAVTAVSVIDPAMAVGARVEHRGSFLGREIAWVTQVERVAFPHLLILRIDDGPFVGQVRYEIQRLPQGGSRATVRTAGEPGRFGFLPAGLIAAPMRSAHLADLSRLKALVEAA